VLGLDRPQLRDRDLEVRQHLQQEGLELRLGLVDLVHQQHHRIVGPNRRQQRPGREEPVREEGVVLAGDAGNRLRQRGRVGDQLTDALAQQLGVEQLFGVLPFVEGLALVEPFIALKPGQLATGDVGECLGELGLAYPGRSFDEHGAAHARGEEHDGGDATVGDVARVPEPLLDLLDRLEHAGSFTNQDEMLNIGSL
jgi:hypothetical protein